RLRLRRELEARIELECDPEIRARLESAMRDFDRAVVTTIHAFAAGLLRERSVQARVDPRFHMMDELESAQSCRDFWRRWVDAELDGDRAARHLRTALLAGVRLEPDLYALASELYAQRDVVDLLPLPRPQGDFATAVRAVQAAARACRDHARAWCRDTG